MIPVNPGQAGQELLGRKVYARLADIPEPIDMVDIFRASAHVPPIVEEALALTPRPEVIWMQLGVRNDEAAALAEANGLKVVMNRCPKIEYGRLSSEISWMGVNSRTLSSKQAPLAGARHPAHVAQPHHHRRAARPTRGRARLQGDRTGALSRLLPRPGLHPHRPVPSRRNALARWRYGSRATFPKQPANEGPAMTERTPGFSTLAIHAGAQPDPTTGARATPIYQTTSFVFEDVDHAASLFGLQTFGNIYTRIGNPTNAVLEERVAALEGGTAGLAVASGHAAQVLVFHCLMQPGDEFVAAKKLYGGSINQFNHAFKNFGWNVVWADPDDSRKLRARGHAEDQGDLHRVDRQPGRRHLRHRGDRQDRASAPACR